MTSPERITEEDTDIEEYIEYMFSLIGSKRKTYRYHKQQIDKRDMIFINLDDNAYIQKYEEPTLAGVNYTSLNFVENILYTLKRKYILKFMNLKQSIRFIRIIKSYIFNSIFTNILFISTFDIKKSINNDPVYNKYMKQLEQLLNLLMQKHNITDEDIIKDAPDYSSKKLKKVTIQQQNVEEKPVLEEKQVLEAKPVLKAKTEKPVREVKPKPVPKSRTIAKPALEPKEDKKSRTVAKPALQPKENKKTRSVAKPALQPKLVPKSRTVEKPALEEKKSKGKQNPSNNKTKIHNRINNNLETRAQFIREKLAKGPQKSILKKVGTTI